MLRPTTVTRPAIKIMHLWKNKVFAEQKVRCTATLNKKRKCD